MWTIKAKAGRGSGMYEGRTWASYEAAEEFLVAMCCVQAYVIVVLT